MWYYMMLLNYKKKLHLLIQKNLEFEAEVVARAPSGEESLL